VCPFPLRSTIRSRATLARVCGCLALGCGGLGALEPDESADPGNNLGSTSFALCDGGDDVRFAYGQGLDARQPILAFGAAEGAAYIAIDGRCRFWLYDMTLQGLRSGVLDPEYANGPLAKGLQLGLYTSLAKFPHTACPDSGGEWAWDTTGSISRSCAVAGEDGKSAEAFTRAAELLTELAPLSNPAWDHVHLLPLRDAERPAAIPSTEWTAALDLATHSASWVDYTNGAVATAGILVEDAVTLGVLRELRIASSERMARADRREINESWYPGLFLLDPRAGELQVLLRDEPPPAVLQILRSRGEEP
jgi:hypothetical protein